MQAIDDSSGHRWPSLLKVLTAVVLVIACCGCPLEQLSQEEQRRQAAASHWITVEPSTEGDEEVPRLNQTDLDAITSTVPTISTVVVERVRTGTIVSGETEAKATVCGTRPEYLRLLEEGARVRVQRGRFLESGEAEEGADVVVISQSLSEKLFQYSNPIGRSVVLEDRTLTVVGVLEVGTTTETDVTRDAYVPLKLFETESDQDPPFPYDRFRFRVESLDHVENTQQVIQSIIEQRHPEENVQVRSFQSDHRNLQDVTP